MSRKSVVVVSFTLVLIMAGISLGCLPAGPAQAPAVSVVSAGPGTYVAHPVREESGSIRVEGNMDANTFIAGDNWNNVNWRTFGSFDISPLAGREVTSAKFVFEGEKVGTPFSGKLGQMLIWQVTWLSPEGDPRALVTADYKIGSRKGLIARLGSFDTESGEIDVTSHVREAVSSGGERFQVKVQFQRTMSDGNYEDDHVLLDMRLEVSYE